MRLLLVTMGIMIFYAPPGGVGWTARGEPSNTAIKTFGYSSTPAIAVASHWVPYPKNPVFKSDPALLDGLPNDPWVVKVGATFVMYYGAVRGDFEEPDRVRIFRATSGDGITWKRNSVAVFSPGHTGSWDSLAVETPSVVRSPDGLQRMYYSGGNFSDSGLTFQIGLATSSNGIAWKKHSGNPVLRLGSKGRFDEESVFEPSVLYKDDHYWMWYTGLSKKSQTALGLAISKDGITWQRKGIVMKLDVERQNAKDSGISEEHVIWNGAQFEMFYALVQNEGRVFGPIWHAVSFDGLHWKKDSEPILRRRDKDSWTGQGIQAPSVLLQGDRYRMWYGGTHTDRKTFLELGIGLAEMQKGY